MTRDQVERLLEETLLAMEKRAAQRATLAQLNAGATPAHLRVPPGDIEMAEVAAAAEAAGTHAAPQPADGGAQPAADQAPAAAGAAADAAELGSGSGGEPVPGGSMRGGLPRPKSLGCMQQAMQRAYNGGGEPAPCTLPCLAACLLAGRWGWRCCCGWGWHAARCCWGSGRPPALAPAETPAHHARSPSCVPLQTAAMRARATHTCPGLTRRRRSSSEAPRLAPLAP